MFRPPKCACECLHGMGSPQGWPLKKKGLILGGSGGFLGTTPLPKVFSHPTLSDPYNSLSSAAIVTRKGGYYVFLIVGKYPEDRPIWWVLRPFFGFVEMKTLNVMKFVDPFIMSF